MTVVRQDTFAGRTVASGWGTASDGNAWSLFSGQSWASSNVASGEGIITGTSSSVFAYLGAALTGADAEGLVRFTSHDLTHDTVGVILRGTASNVHVQWLGRWSGGNLQIMYGNGTGFTSLGTSAFALTAGTFYWLRFRCQGTTISLRAWADGSTEPTTWTLQYTSSNVSAAGVAGLYGYSSTGLGVYVDSFSVDDLASATSYTGAATFPVNVSLSASPVTSYSGAATIPVAVSLSASATQVQSASATIPVSIGLSASAPRGIGIGDITRTTGTQYANKSGNGYGTGDISGTEHDFAYTDSTGSGWAVGVNPWYGGMPISAWYQIDPGLNTTLPQKTSANGNLMTLLTTQSGGIVHWEEAVGGTYQASELPTFNNAGNFTELAPANTAFRAYVKCLGDATDSNGIAWTAYACIYPGDPGFVVFRLDQHNPSGSAITFDESDLELIASLLGDGGTNPTGVWNISNGYVNTIGGTPTQWSNPGNTHTGTFDYAWITPDSSQTTISLGTGAVVLNSPQSQFGWEATTRWEVNDDDPQAAKPTRIKMGFYSPTISYSMAAGATNTYYVLRVFSRDLTQSRMDGIAADFINHGTPTATTGTYTSYSTDERAYVFAASSNALTATLDMTGTGVVARYKPIIKITGWTDSNAPLLTWGGTKLTSGTDYRYTYDSTNTTLYLQLYFDVVSSGATTGQRNNAALAVTPLATTGAATIPVNASLSASAVQVVAGSATIPVAASLAADGVQVLTGAATVPVSMSLSASAHATYTAAASIPLAASLSATGLQVLTGAAHIPLAASLTATGHETLSGAATIPLHASLSADSRQTVTAAADIAWRILWSASGLQVLTGSATVPVRASLSASPTVPPSPAKITSSSGSTSTVTATSSATATITAGSTP